MLTGGSVHNVGNSSKVVLSLMRVCLVVLLAAAATVRGADTPLVFDDPVQEQRYRELVEELRCLVCQNQNLADSHADLAQDLREEIHRMIQAGQSNEEIKVFMVARYGDFVLYRPPVKKTTWLLWGSPFLLLILGIIAAYRMAASRGGAAAVPDLDATERSRLQSMLDREHDK